MLLSRFRLSPPWSAGGRKGWNQSNHSSFRARRQLPLLSFVCLDSDARWIEDVDTRRQTGRKEEAEALILSKLGGARFAARGARVGVAARIVRALAPLVDQQRPTTLSFLLFFTHSLTHARASFPSIRSQQLSILGRVRREAQAPPRALQRHAHAREAVHPLHGQGKRFFTFISPLSFFSSRGSIKRFAAPTFLTSLLFSASKTEKT